MKWRKYVVDNSWTWGGTSLVLLTLTGSTLYWALCITVGVVIIHAILTAGLKDD